MRANRPDPANLLSLLSAMKTKIRRFSGALLFVAVALAVAACGDPAPTSPTSIPDAVLTTDTFGGNISSGASSYHLIAAKTGQVVLTMTGLSDPSIALGMEIGVYSTLSCTAVIQNPSTTIGNQLVGLTTTLTTLCIRIYDPGTVPTDGTVTYEIKVSHY
jgi:hypothetical protein